MDYRKIRDGELTDAEEDFYEMVLKDFNNCPDYARFEIWAPDRDVDINDIRVHAEILHKQLEIGFIVLDHGALMESRKKHRDYTIELNAVLRDAKKLALHFDNGAGVPILMLFQLNRQGKDDADKNEGRYKMKALSYANEAERSADVVTTTYLNDEHRANGTTVVCCLKNRDNPFFVPFLAAVDFRCRRLFNHESTIPGFSVSEDEHDDLLTGLYDGV